MASLIGASGRLLAFGRAHRRVISLLLDVLCVLFIVLLYITEQTTLWLHCVYVTLSLGAFIRGGGLPTLARSTTYTAVMVVYMFHIQATDDFLEIPMMWIISVLAAGLAQVSENANREHRRLAATDHLTGIANRREFDARLAASARYGLAVLAIDVDGLKPINDKFGHEAGDAVLLAVAVATQAAVRGGDLVARTGGDEFAVILHRADAEVAADIAERVRAAVRSQEIPHGRVSVSVGWAVGGPPTAASRIVQSADQALYQAKLAGRDRVVGSMAELVSHDAVA